MVRCSLSLAVGAVLVGGSLLVACGAGASTGLAWPKPAASASDGGESLSPRQASSVAAAIEESDDASPSAPATAPSAASAAPAPAAKPDKPVASGDTPAAKEPDVLTTEDIVIEIED